VFEGGCQVTDRAKKGFTIAELLIAVAIIGILVAVAIPIFNNQMEKAREAHDLATMRSAASAAVDLYYAGVHDSASAYAAGMDWNTGGGKEGTNAFGAYDPKTGKFYKSRDLLPAGSKTYGKGTSLDGGTVFESGNPNGAYIATLDYRNAVCMVSMYVLASHPHVDVYWKYNAGSNKGKYVGSNEGNNIPKYCMRIYIN